MQCRPPESFPQKRMLLTEDEGSDDVFNILSGTVTLSAVTSDGVRRVLDFAIPGDLVGLAREHFPFSAQAADGVVAWRIKRTQLVEAAGRHAGVLAAMHDATLRELGRSLEHVVLLESRSAGEKVARFILSYGARWNAAGAPPHCVAVSMSRQDLAGYLGLAPETLSRTLAHFERTNAITAAPHEICIVDRGALRRAAQGPDGFSGRTAARAEGPRRERRRPRDSPAP